MTLKWKATRFGVIRNLLPVGACVLTAAGMAARAQGVLTVTPARSVSTASGNGSAGYSGDGGAATAAQLYGPGAVVYDTAGNIYIADTRNHVVRMVAPNGTISTVAGTGAPGFAGDGGAATSALLDTPTGLAVDSGGNLYIADSRNNRVRLITGGTITTFAGTGAAGFSGDGSAATAAMLAQPSGVAVDSGGNVFIADTNNQRVRRVSGGNITTVAGTGVQDFTGDGSPATGAALDSPFSVAIDASGNLYIADRHNHRVRLVTYATGNISTFAGSGSASAAGGYSGEGVSATTAVLSKPSGVAVDAAGSVYIADTNNQRIREVAGGAIATVVGTGVQGFSGDGGSAANAPLDTPRGIASDAAGNLALAGAGSQRVRSAAVGVLTFGNQPAGTLSAAQTITLQNTGSAPITVTGFAFTGDFIQGPGTTCSTPSLTLNPGDSCGFDVQFSPAMAGAATGKVSFTGSGVVTQMVALAGTSSASAAAKLGFTTPPASPIAAGGNAGTVQLGVEDSSGDVITSDPGTLISLTVTGPNGYSATYSATASSGIATFALASTPLTVAGTYTYTATATTLTQAVATEVVNPAALAAFSVTGLGPFSAPQIAGTATVKAVDMYGNIVTSFTGPVSLTSSDATATISPATYTYAGADAGTHTYSVTFRTAGTQTVTATAGATTGSQTGIVVRDAIWVLNTTDALARLTDDGTQTTAAGAGGGTSTQGAIAFDHAGVVWVTQQDSNGYARYAADGTLLSSSNGVGLHTPTSLAIDGAGQAWIANSGNGSVSVLDNSGAAITTTAGYQPGALSSPSGLVVDSSGSVWVTNSGANSVTRIIGSAAPVVAPIVTGTVNNTLGTRP